MTNRQSIVGMHLVALAWGTSAVLGAMISAPSAIITVGRCLFAMAALFLAFRFKPFLEFIALPRKLAFWIVINGIFIGLHWICFFGSVKFGSVALALVTYSTASILIAIGEVIFLRMPFRLSILLAAILSALGVWLIHPVQNSAQLLDLGLLYGMGSAFTITVVALAVKHLLSSGVGAVTISFNQLIFATIVSLPFAIYNGIAPVSWHDIYLIALLGVICTACGQTLFNFCAKSVRISSAAVIASMEVPYGVLMAAVILKQAVTLEVILGIIMVTTSAIMVSLKKS